MVVITLKGDIVLNETLVLHNVLYVPGFSFNLLSISHLTNHSSFDVTFLSTHCVLHDRLTKTVIGAAEQDGGLCHLKFHVVSCLNSVSDRNNSSFSLWHSRLGHASLKCLSHIKDINVKGQNVFLVIYDIWLNIKDYLLITMFLVLMLFSI